MSDDPSASAPASSAGPGSPSGAVLPSRAVSPSSASRAAETLTGTVEAGVEPGCLVLKGSGGDHLLIFDPRTLRTQAKVGSSITVVGRAEPTQITTCQQGIPFVVSSVRAN